MVIEKVLNNNMVISRNPEGKEIILQGKGIGFNKRKRCAVHPSDFIYDVPNGFTGYLLLLFDSPSELLIDGRLM